MKFKGKNSLRYHYTEWRRNKMLEVSHLSKQFGSIKAVDDLSFSVRKGTTFAFLGTNGAGKSTVIHMIIGLLKPDKGEINFDTDTLSL